MTKEEVIRTRNVLKCGTPNPTTELEKKKLCRPVCIRTENGIGCVDEVSSFVMWDDDNEMLYAIARGNGINGGWIPQSAQAYGNTGWKTGINGENFQIVAIPYWEISSMCTPATMDHVQEFLNYYKTTLPAGKAAAFQKAADIYMKYHVKPLHDVETYVASPQEDTPYPYPGTPTYDEAAQKWVNPDGTDAKVDATGLPYADPDRFMSSDDRTTMM